MGHACIRFHDGAKIEDYTRPYIVAEVNSSHNGDIETAKKMIDAAAACGCDCVKFQSWTTDSLYAKTYYKENPIAKRFVDKFSLSADALRSMSEYCRTKGVSFSSTPYSEAEVDFLIDMCNVPFIKIASMELNHPDFLRYIGQKKIPVVLSTGMGEMEEIRQAVKILQEAGTTQLVLLHCVSLYPTKVETVNLNNIIGLRKAFPACPVGFSDHTEGDAAAVAAVALGSAVIEKHLTLDRRKVGMDNGMAAEPNELRQLVDKCRMIQTALGSEERIVQPEEYEQRKKMRRSVCVTRDLPAGHILERSDLYAKRPGTGISPEHIESLIGHRLKRAVENDMLLYTEDMED